jgi:hypothetical protein
MRLRWPLSENPGRAEQLIQVIFTRPGRNHFGLHVQNMGAAIMMFRQRGANVSESRCSPTKAILANITDPNRVRIELAELPPDSLHRRSMERWSQQ